MSLEKVERAIKDGHKKIEAKQIALEERLGKIEAKNRKRSVSLPGVNETGESWSLHKVIRGMALGGLDAPSAWADAGFEREVGLEARKRALSYGTDSAGGYAVPEQYLAELIDLLRAKTVVMELGATEMSDLKGSPLKIPRLASGAAGAWVAENGTISAEDQTFEEVSLEPHQAAAMTKMSNRLVMLSSPSAEAIVRNDLMAALARLIDLAALRGTGASNQPTGIANTSGVTALTLSGDLDIDALYDTIYEIELDNADAGSLGWCFHPRTLNQLRKLRAGGSTTTDGPYLLQPDPAKSVSGTLAGFPYRTTTQIPIDLGTAGDETELYFGNWKDLLVARWGGIEIRASQDAGTAFEANQTWVRAIAEVDIGVRHPESFAVMDSIGA